MAATFYEICIQEILDERFAGWFDGLEFVPSAAAGTLLRGPLTDKAALHGLLNRICDLNLTLVSLRQLPPSAPSEISKSLSATEGK